MATNCLFMNTEIEAISQRGRLFFISDSFFEAVPSLPDTTVAIIFL